jgi:SSS family transporter
MATTTVIVISIYVLALIAIGLYSSGQSKTVNKFLLGDRGVGPWFSAFAYGTTYFSAVIFIGYAGNLGWNIGISTVWIGIGNAMIGSFFAWKIFAEKTRQYTHHHDVKTMPEFFESRYSSVAFKKLAALVIFIFLVPYSASVYMGLGYLFQILGIDYNLCMYIIAFVTAFYVFLGGYKATIISDFFQGIIMLLGVVIMVWVGVSHPLVGGISNIIPRLNIISPELVAPFGGSKWYTLASLVFLTSIGSWGLPQMMNKFYAIKDKKSVETGTIISTVFAFIIATSAYFVGSLSRLYFTNANVPKVGATAKINFDAIMPNLFAKIFEGGLGEIALATIAVLVLSASMSTLASIVMTSSSAISIDLFDKNTKFEFAKKHQLFFLRILCVVFILLSLLIAMNKPTVIIDLMAFSWGTVAGSFIGPYFWGLYMKRTNKVGAFSGAAVAFVISFMGIIVKLFIPTVTTIPFVEFIRSIPAPLLGSYAMIASFVVTPIVSLLTNKTK